MGGFLKTSPISALILKGASFGQCKQASQDSWAQTKEAVKDCTPGEDPAPKDTTPKDPKDPKDPAPKDPTTTDPATTTKVQTDSAGIQSVHYIFLLAVVTFLGC